MTFSRAERGSCWVLGMAGLPISALLGALSSARSSALADVASPAPVAAWFSQLLTAGAD